MEFVYDKSHLPVNRGNEFINYKLIFRLQSTYVIFFLVMFLTLIIFKIILSIISDYSFNIYGNKFSCALKYLLYINVH